MMPFSFQGLGAAALLIMIGILSLNQLIQHLRDRHQHPQS